MIVLSNDFIKTRLKSFLRKILQLTQTTSKAFVTKEIPDAKVYLFGSQAAGTAHEESDWDILILTKKKYPKSVKWLIHDKLFPLGLFIGSVFSFIIATNDEWENHPAYYSLQKGIGEQYFVL